MRNNQAAMTKAGQTATPPRFSVPSGACDCHVHVFEPDRFPYIPSRRYTPGQASVDDLLALQHALGLSRVVLVQPSVYGADHACLLDALRRLGPRAKGVGVIDDAMPPPLGDCSPWPIGSPRTGMFRYMPPCPSLPHSRTRSPACECPPLLTISRWRVAKADRTSRASRSCSPLFEGARRT